MAWDNLLPLGLPLLGIVAVGGMAALGRMPGTRRWFSRPRIRGIPMEAAQAALQDLPHGLRRMPSGEVALAPNWLDRPALVGKFVGPAGWFIPAFGLMLIANLALITEENDQGRRLIASMMAKTLCVGLIPLALVCVKRLLGGWLECVLHFVQLGHRDIQEWFASQIEKLFLARSNLAIGIVVGVLILWFERIDNAFVQVSVWRQVVVVLASFVMTTLAGFSLVIMVKGAMLVSRVGRLPIYVSTSPYGVLSTGTMLVRAFVVATSVYMVALLTMVLRSQHPDQFILSWAIAVAALYVVMFLLPQWSIHRRMVAVKRQWLLRVETQLQRYWVAFDANPDKPTGDVIETLRKRRDEIVALPEWPFNWKNIGSVLGLAASSTLPIVVKALLSAVTLP